MTPAEVQTIRSTFVTIGRDRGFTTAFHARLFDRDPSLRSILPAVQDDRGRLGALMAAFVERLDQPEALKTFVTDLVGRQRGCGLQPRHYAAISQALLTTLEWSLAKDFTNEVRTAWTDACVLLAETMMKATYSRFELVA